MRAVLDVNVIIAAVLSPTGTCAAVVRAWLDGAYELIVSPALLDELARALRYPKIRRHVPEPLAARLVDLLRTSADLRQDPTYPPPVKSPDPGDDYVISLAAASRALIVTGDRHLLDLDGVPVYPPRTFLELILSGQP